VLQLVRVHLWDVARPGGAATVLGTFRRAATAGFVQAWSGQIITTFAHGSSNAEVRCESLWDRFPRMRFPFPFPMLRAPLDCSHLPNDSTFLYWYQ
jgi:hypothetical protein